MNKDQQSPDQPEDREPERSVSEENEQELQRRILEKRKKLRELEQELDKELEESKELLRERRPPLPEDENDFQLEFEFHGRRRTPGREHEEFVQLRSSIPKDEDTDLSHLKLREERAAVNVGQNELAWFDPERCRQGIEQPALMTWLNQPAVMAWMKPFITTETYVDDEWGTQEEYITQVHLVDDFTPVQEFLASRDPYERHAILQAFLFLAELPENAFPILDILHETVLGRPAPDPAQDVPLSPVARLFMKHLHPFAVPNAHRWGVPINGFRAQVVFVIRHIARTFLEAQQPMEVAVFQKAASLLEEIMLGSEEPALRVIAAELLDGDVYFSKNLMGFRGFRSKRGLFTPRRGEPQAVLAKWGDVETRVQHLFDIAANPQEPARLRNVAFGILRRNITVEEGQLRFTLLDTWRAKDAYRILRLALDLLWENPGSTKWNEEGMGHYSSPIYQALSLVLRFRRFLSLKDDACLLELVRRVLIHPMHPHNSSHYTKSPLKGWYLMKMVIYEFLKPIDPGPRVKSNKVTQGRINDRTEQLKLKQRQERQREKSETFLLDLIRSPTDLDVLRSAQNWAQQRGLSELWEQVLLKVQAKLE